MAQEKRLPECQTTATSTPAGSSGDWRCDSGTTQMPLWVTE